jgi:hypothetical protein
MDVIMTINRIENILNHAVRVHSNGLKPADLKLTIRARYFSIRKECRPWACN